MCETTKTRTHKPTRVDDTLKREADIKDIEESLASWKRFVVQNKIQRQQEVSSKWKIYELQLKTIDREVKLAAQAILLVRRAAMKELLETEYQQFLEELSQMGKVIYKDRL
uniref:cilia- and flagella-associated protein 141-like n=1 Tax=Pristiophorus japonicus TaxID=55135 RepID=UPI00398F2711